MKAGSGRGEGFWEVGYTELDLGGKVTGAMAGFKAPPVDGWVLRDE